MNKKLIPIKIIAPLISALLVGYVFLSVFSTIGGNFMTDFTFLGGRGYEATGLIGIIFGLPLGGMFAAYLARHKFGVAQQEASQAILIGLLVGVVLLLIVFANQTQKNYDQLRFNSGTTAIESQYPEFKNLDCFASCSFKYDKDGDDYYFAYIVHGSGVPIVKATCFKVDKDSVVTKVGEFSNPADSYIRYQDINTRTCVGTK